jgi:hypothetical protein
MSTIEKDIEKAKKSESCSVQMTDGKIVCNFSLNLDKISEYGRWTNFQKVFDDWDSFTKYAEDFFTT